MISRSRPELKNDQKSIFIAYKKDDTYLFDMYRYILLHPNFFKMFTKTPSKYYSIAGFPVCPGIAAA